MQPVQLKYAFSVPITGPGTTDHYVDLSQIASLVNRKFMRQGMNWVVSNVELVTDGTVGMQISKLPDTWVMANAWVKSFKLWQESQDQVLDIEGRDILGKFADFKIFYDSAHQVAGVANNLKPHGFAVAAAGAEYDWDATTYQIPNDPAGGTTTEYNIHALGPSTAASLGAIAGYAASRARPQQNDPNVVDSASPEDWMTSLFDVGENLEEIRQDIEDGNDSPPYLLGAPGSQLEYYPGGSLQATSSESWVQDFLQTRSAPSALAMDSSGAFLAPCGLLKLSTNYVGDETAPTQIDVFIELSPGPVRGFLAEPMQEMN